MRSSRYLEPQSASHGLMYKSRVRTEPTNVTAPQYAAALWSSLEALVEEMTSCCVKVYALENVLKLKKDPMTHVVFLDEAMKVGAGLRWMQFRLSDMILSGYARRSTANRVRSSGMR